ncbi:MAG: crosslink repair DNA glycosylase YcaQ family protein, partial [Candidatus Latescibacteria bacterium]|nr:crosslink repair DNA glycosylase YcaQ family protein [Candidatus Latescibacterota bacterium]
MPHSITNAHARRLALRAQGLDGTWRPGRGVNGAGAIVERLGYVQIDTIAVIERAHEHILWTRQPSYRPSYLQRLMQDRRVFEYWTHAASYVPMM